MTSYAYRAQTVDARVVRGVVAAPDAGAALAQMERMRLRPIELRPYREPPWRRLALLLRRGAPAGEKLLLLRQLQTMLGSGIPLVRALSALGSQVENARVRVMVNGVRADVEGGSTLAEACARQPGLFTPLQVQMVRAAEQSGLLEEMLARMGDLHEKEMEIQRNVRSALFYPGLVVGELGLAIGVILKFVFPRFVQIFAGFSADLPAPTVALIKLSSAFDRYGWLLPPLGVAAFVGYRLARRRPGFAVAADRLKLRLPLLGPVFQKIHLSRFSHLLANLVAAGIPLVAALRLGAYTLGNTWLRQDAIALREGVERGNSVAASMAALPAFPPVCREMIAVGEESGRLVETLRRVSEYYDSQVDFAIKNLTVAIEPILLLVLGAVVLFVALAVFLPMWDLMGAIRG